MPEPDQPAAADKFGPKDDNPYWNESVWFSVSVPERRMHGLIQYYFRPNMGLLNGGPVLWDPSGTYQWNCLHYQWSHLQALPTGQEKFNMRARNTLSVRVIEPLRRYKIDYAKDGCELDLEWSAVGPMHELRTGDPGQQATAKFHIEQPGRMKGTIRRHGEEWSVDCWSMRDTSYGARDYESLARGGYLMRDGQMASLASGRREVLDWGNLGPARVRFTGSDMLGREIEAIGQIDPGLIFTGYTDHRVVWSLVEWQWDGQQGWGDNQEFCPDETFRRIARGEVSVSDPA
jgi:hypothetical protein